MNAQLSVLSIFAITLFYSMFRPIPQLINVLWDLIPDRCQVKGCSRKGRRGWENLEDGVYVCDYCSVRYFLMKQGFALE